MHESATVPGSQLSHCAGNHRQRVRACAGLRQQRASATHAPCFTSLLIFKPAANVVIDVHRRYDPYARLLLREQYDHTGMRRVRRSMVQRARVPGQSWGVILGTLGRQGNPHTFDRLCDLLRKHGIESMLVRSFPCL